MGEFDDLTAVILAGGLGTRLRPVVSDRPKVLAPVQNRPFLSYLLDAIAAAGIRHAILCTGYMGDHVEAAFGSAHGSLQLRYSRETEPLGTGGALRLAARHIATSRALVANGDSFCAAELPAFMRWQRERNATIAICLTRVPNTARYGRVETDADDRVVRFLEKDGRDEPGWINAGLYCMDAQVWKSIEPTGPVSLEREVFPAWVERGLFGLKREAAFIDIGLPEDFARAQSFFAQRDKRG